MIKPQKTRDRIQRILKESGPSSAQALGNWLELTPMAVRQHLYEMVEQGLVISTDQRQGKGRPLKLWALTSGADAMFGDAHADLTVDLIGRVRDVLGEAALEQLLEARSKDQVKAYQGRLSQGAPLIDNLEALAAIRAEEGYMAKVEEGDDGDLLLVENHCPICRAAQACTGLCAHELDVFRDVLGPDVEVERTEHIIQGARRCAYRVCPKRAS